MAVRTVLTSSASSPSSTLSSPRSPGSALASSSSKSANSSGVAPEADQREQQLAPLLGLQRSPTSPVCRKLSHSLQLQRLAALLVHRSLRLMRLRWRVIVPCALLLSLAALYVALLAVPHLDPALDPLLELGLWWTSLDEAEALCMMRPASSSVVSLTSLPARLPHIERTLKSLLLQTHCPRAVHLFVPRVNARLQRTYAVEPGLAAFLRRSYIVRLQWLEVDFGPATKLLPFLLEHEALGYTAEQRVAVVDDDVLYSAHMLEQYDCWGPLLPRAALGFGGCFVHAETRSDLIRCPRGTELSAPLEVQMLFGTAGFQVQPALFNLSSLRAFAVSAPHAAHFEDDVYFAGEEKRAGARRFLLPIDRRQVVQLDTLLVERDSLINSDNSGNAHFNAMLQWYKDVQPEGQRQEEPPAAAAVPSPTRCPITWEPVPWDGV